MGVTVPQKQTTGSSSLRTILLAVLYVALVPAVSFAALWAGVTYFPDATGSLIRPLVQGLTVEDSVARAEIKALAADVTGLVSRVDQLDAAVEGLREELKNLPVAAAEGEHSVDGDPQIRAVETSMTKNANLLLALNSLTAARAEYLVGNREVTLREIASARTALSRIRDLDPEILSTLEKAATEVGKDSAMGMDWLKLSWHSVASSLGLDTTQKPQ